MSALLWTVTLPTGWWLFALFIGVFVGVSGLSWLASFGVMLTLAPLRALIVTQSPLQLPLEIGQLCFIAFLGFGISYALLRGYRIAWKPTPPLTALMVFVFVSGATLPLSWSFQAALVEWLKWASIAILCVSLSFLLHAQQWRWAMAWLVFSAMANALVGIYIHYGGSGAEHMLISAEQGTFRAFGTFEQPNPFGGFMGLVLPIAISTCVHHMLLGWQHKQLRQVAYGVLFAVASALIGAGLFMSWSRGAWLSIVVALSGMVVLLPRKLSQSVALAVGVSGLVAGIWLSGILPASIQSRIASSTTDFFAFDDVRGVEITSENFAVVERLAHWQAALNMAHDHLWLGVGFGNYEVAYPQYRLLYWTEALGHAHNYYLNLLAEVGVVGLVTYVTLVLVQLVSLWHIRRRHPSAAVRWACLGMMGSWFYLSSHSLLDNLYVNNLFLHVGVIVAITSAFYQQTFDVTTLE